MRLPRLVLGLLCLGGAYADQGGLYPPGLLPLINRANALLSTGQFSEAAKIYTEAIDQSPADYLLYYKRATAQLSLQRHAAALEDFNKVLSLTSNTFDNAHLMKARIYIKEGQYDLARPSLKLYMKAKSKDQDAEELEKEIEEGEQLYLKLDKERKSQLWTACVDTASSLLRKASHAVEVRSWRAECAFASGDLESAAGDLSRLSHLLQPSTTLLSHIFRLSYFLLPPSPGAMNALKQCLLYDPDSKICLPQHRLVKNLDKGFAQVDELLGKEDWRGVVKLLLTSGGGKTSDLWRKFEDAMEENVKEDAILPLIPPELLESAIPDANKKTKKLVLKSLPMPNASKISVQRQTLVRALCKSFTHLADQSKGDEYKGQMGKWCSELLTLEGCADDMDGLVGKGEDHLGNEEYDEAVRVFEKAFEASGRSDRNIHSRLQKAQKLLKQSKQKDYYKVLGVSRDADEKTIRKAFRQAAKSAHPDKGGSEAKMSTINEAYEVLTDPELRARFDAGDDPNDPSGGMGGNPFAQGGHPFGQFFNSGGFPGGSGGFQFHFNGHAGGRKGH
ncbi:hypothetical protein Agabi119p4_4897 [Agaricus bisporus var. burnettii]|uniref:J domain-containing protein n=1 Tax=Agaricus bisporus var. burnettii TaxID=192524 RepID=A0A8H7KHC9_AGABI|nr:hypothetical protein Agabi119p4_4897 [Agaricus bisporus var. burnettii]